MNTHADKSQESKSQAVANSLSKQQSNSESTFQFVGNRSEAIAQRKLQEAINNSPRMQQLKAYQEMANNSPQANQATQLKMDNYSMYSPIQLVGQNPLSGQVVQRLSIEYYTKAQITFGLRGLAHLSEQRIRNYLAIYHNEIVVGEDQTIKIGKGRETGYEVWGNIKYNCTYDENNQCHNIHVWHAHEGERMG